MTLLELDTMLKKLKIGAYVRYHGHMYHATVVDEHGTKIGAISRHAELAIMLAVQKLLN